MKLNVFSSFRPGYSEQAFGFTHINPFEFRAKLSFKSAAYKPSTLPFPNGWSVIPESNTPNNRGNPYKVKQLQLDFTFSYGKHISRTIF